MNTPKDRIVLNDIYEIVELVSEALRHSEANKVTASRLDEAHAYCQQYLMPEAWGKNVWHSILDDAIRMRKEKEPLTGWSEKREKS